MTQGNTDILLSLHDMIRSPQDGVGPDKLKHDTYSKVKLLASFLTTGIVTA